MFSGIRIRFISSPGPLNTTTTSLSAIVISGSSSPWFSMAPAHTHKPCTAFLQSTTQFAQQAADQIARLDNSFPVNPKKHIIQFSKKAVNIEQHHLSLGEVSLRALTVKNPL